MGTAAASASSHKKTVVQRYAAGWQAYMQLPEVPPPPTSTSTLHLYPPPPPSTSTLQAKQMLDGYDVRKTALKDAALSPGGTHRVHVLFSSPRQVEASRSSRTGAARRLLMSLGKHATAA